MPGATESTVLIHADTVEGGGHFATAPPRMGITVFPPIEQQVNRHRMLSVDSVDTEHCLCPYAYWTVYVRSSIGAHFYPLIQ